MVYQQEILPSYQEISKKFESARQLPKKRSVGFFESQKKRILNLISRFKDKIFGIPSVSEYDTGQRMMWLKNGEKMQYDHIKDGSKTSTTTKLFTQNRLNGRLSFHQITASDNFDTDSKTVLQRILKSQYSHLEGTDVQMDIITESTLAPDGSEYSKTQDFHTGETVFREEKEGIRKEWTFDKNKRLVSSYEGCFQDEEWKGRMVEKKYNYTKTGILKSIQEKEIKITPDGEKVSEKTNILGGEGTKEHQTNTSILSEKSHPVKLDNSEKKQSKEKMFTAKLIQKIQDKAGR